MAHAESLQRLSVVQERHARLILELSANLRALRYKLCPSRMREVAFWRVYFSLARNKTGDLSGPLPLFDVEEALAKAEAEQHNAHRASPGERAAHAAAAAARDNAAQRRHDEAAVARGQALAANIAADLSDCLETPPPPPLSAPFLEQRLDSYAAPRIDTF